MSNDKEENKKEKPETEKEGEKEPRKDDESVEIAKEIGTSAGKKAGVRLAKDVLLEGRPLGPSIEQAFRSALEKAGEEIFKEWQKDLNEKGLREARATIERVFGKSSEQVILSDLWSSEYFSTFGKTFMDFRADGGKDVFDKLGDKNLVGLNAYAAGKQEAVPYGRRQEKEGFEVDFKPKGNINIDFPRLAQKGPRPEVVKEAEVGFSLDAVWRSRVVEVKVGVEGASSLKPKDAKSWREVTRKEFLEKYGGGEISTKADLRIKPNDRISITFGAETSIGHKKDLEWRFTGGLEMQLGGAGRLGEDFYKKYGE